jgi:hypothetical protein
MLAVPAHDCLSEEKDKPTPHTHSPSMDDNPHRAASHLQDVELLQQMAFPPTPALLHLFG